MDILNLIRKDHHNVMLLFDRLEQLEESGKSKKDDIFNQLRQELEAHMMGEEAIFYPDLLENADLRPMMLEALEEHHVVKIMLHEMSGIPKDERWDAKLAVLRENVEHHIEDEEDDIFPNAETVFNKKQREETAGRMSEMKKEQLAGAK